jgi:hypothetical protein
VQSRNDHIASWQANIDLAIVAIKPRSDYFTARCGRVGLIFQFNLLGSHNQRDIAMLGSHKRNFTQNTCGIQPAGYTFDAYGLADKLGYGTRVWRTVEVYWCSVLGHLVPKEYRDIVST